MTPDNTHHWAEVMRRALQELVNDRDFELPLTCVSVSANGSVLAVEYCEVGEDVEAYTVCEHYNEPGFKLPINIFLVDPRGVAARMLVTSERANSCRLPGTDNPLISP